MRDAPAGTAAGSGEHHEMAFFSPWRETKEDSHAEVQSEQRKKGLARQDMMYPCSVLVGIRQ